MLNTVIFDMDGVLIDSERVSRRAWLYAAEVLNIEDIDDTYTDCIGLNLFDRSQYFYKKYGKDFDFEGFRSIVAPKYRSILDNEGLLLKLGVFELLHFLSKNNFRIALATSTSTENTEKNLKRTSLYPYFEKIVTGDTVEHGKPSPEIYLSACREMNVDPKDAVAVEDSFNGVVSASSAGMKVVLVPDIQKPTEETLKLVYKKYDSLYGFLKELRNKTF